MSARECDSGEGCVGLKSTLRNHRGYFFVFGSFSDLMRNREASYVLVIVLPGK